MCNNWPDFPISVYGATGGLIGNNIMICGGWGGWGSSYFDECYSLTSETATFVIHMSVGRFFAASIVLNDKTLWVTGGYTGVSSLASTEYVTMTGTKIGPDLPMALQNHAMVAINSTCSMIIGGYSGGTSALTFFYYHNEGEWITGPSLIESRDGPAAGIVTDEVTNEHFVAVTGGKYYSDAWFNLDSSELLQDREWVQGKMNMLSFGIFLEIIYGQI